MRQDQQRIFRKAIKHRVVIRITFLLVFSLVPGQLEVKAQTNKYNQLSNEFQFTRAINDKWVGETWLGGTFSDTPTEPRPLSTNIQRYIYIWGHYYYSPKWKFSGSLAYFHNKDVPDIGQYFSPEFRITTMGTYYINRVGYILTTRMRLEFRYMMNEEGYYEDKYRYRQQLKFVKPLNSKFLRQGVFYALTSEEVYFRGYGGSYFDRNRFEAGAGYLITDDLQVELVYSNEYLPREGADEMYNILTFTVTANNLFTKIKGKLSNKPKE